MAAVDKAEELIGVLGEGPYPLPLLMEICEVETKRGPKQYATLIDFAGTPSEVALAELDAVAEEADTEDGNMEVDLTPSEAILAEAAEPTDTTEPLDPIPTPEQLKPLTRAEKAKLKKLAEAAAQA